VRPLGISIAGRRAHSAVAYLESMVVYGGVSENGNCLAEMLVYNFNENEWIKLKY
jgi:hypothetical protein